MIKYAHTDDFVTVDHDTREDDRMVPESLMFGVEYDVAREDEDWQEALEWDYDLCRSARMLAAMTFAYGF